MIENPIVSSAPHARMTAGSFLYHIDRLNRRRAAPAMIWWIISDCFAGASGGKHDVREHRVWFRAHGPDIPQSV